MIENYDNKKIQSFEYETTAISDGNIIGTCELGNATIQMINDSNEYSSLKGQWIKTIHGSFYIHDVEPVQEKVNIKLSCYDIKYKLDTPYDSSLYTWPMTLKQWRNAIGTNCGITFDNGDFPNSGMELSAEPYVGDNPSNRNVISQIAQAGCSFVDTDKDDIFYFKWFEDATHQVDDWLELTTEKEISKQVNVVVLGRGDTEDNVCYPTTKPTNPVEFRIDNNYILDPQIEGQDQRYNVIKQIYNRVNGFSYLVFNMRTQNVQNKLSIALGQKVSYKDIWGNNLNSYIMSKKITYLGGDPTDDDNYEITLSAEEIKETSTELSYSASIENKILKVERIANKQEGKIQDIITEQNEHSSKINTLEMTSSSTLSKISNVEKEVDTLSDDIDGVSADFKNFKDNEYIQSINNLQDQIDGAIQFWNGAEIPTLENYPTNDWTTENDKINHQADIYTVIQDVEGEMKQGKSYRFDKINGVWQWIELTDNELSAVQSLAQEALNKAKSNANDISTIKTNVSELQQTDKQIKASVSSTENRVNILEETVEIYSIDLDLYNLTIPVNTENKPIETKLYEIGYYAYYKGKQVTPTIISKSTADGIDISTTNGKINLSVNQNNTINNINNELVFEFHYTVDGVANIISKKIIVVLAQQGPQGLQGLQGIQGKQGIQGEKGDTGESGLTSYFHIKYSSVENPTNPNQISETPNVYIGTYVDYTEQDSTDPSKYKWSRFQGLQGETGTQGIPGKNGTDGKTSYLHIKYSNDGGQTFTANSGETVGDYIGQYTDFTLEDSTEVNSYTWSKIKGEQGPQGIQGIQGVKGEDGISTYFYIRYSANANGSSMTTAPQSDTQYMGVASTTSPTAPTSSSGYIWSKIKGEQGEQGIPGQIGESGKTSYLHIKYSENGTTFTPADSEYNIGEKPSRWQGTYVDFNENDSTKFSDYKWVDTAIVVEDLVTPTNTVSGSNIHIEDASDKKMVNFEIEGKSTQKTRSGKNLLKIKNTTSGGLTTVVNTDGSISVSGTATRDIAYIDLGENTNLPIGDYTLSLKNSISVNLRMFLYNNSSSFGTMTITSGNTSTTTTISKTIESYNLIVYGLNAGTYYNFTIKPMLESGSTATEFEPYGVMPSPDYPSEIESVGYRNLLDLSKCTSLNCIINNDGTIKSNISNHYYCELFADYLSSYFMKHLGETFTFSVEPIITGKQISIVIHGTRSDGSTYQEISATSSKSVSITIADNFTSITSVRIRFNRNSSAFTDTETVFSNLMLTKGTQKRSYIPYGKYGIEVKNTGKNLLNATNYNANNYVSQLLTLKAGTYTVHYQGDKANGIYIRNANGTTPINGTVVLEAYNRNMLTFTINKDGNYYIQFYKSGSGFTSFSNAQLEKGSVATDFVSYREPRTSLFVLDQPLRSLPNGVKDIAYIKNNILYVDRKVGSKIFDGNDNFSINKSNNDYISFYITNHLAKTLNKKNRMSDNFTTAIWIGEADNLTKECYWQHNVASMGFVILKSRLATSDVAGFKSWLSTHNTQVDYELAEPYTEKIGEVEIPSTFKGVNNITTTDELEPVMNIEYVRDTILSDYVEGQVSNAVAIQERKNAEFQITNEEIKSTVSAISTNLDGTKSSLKSVEEKITSQEKTIKIISKNIDSTTGNITEVTTTNGFTFNSNGLKIYIDENSYNTVIDNVGTYYKDGDAVINQTTKDGSILTNLSEKGQTKYSYNENDDYDFIEERIESDGEYAYATFYNGEE